MKICFKILLESINSTDPLQSFCSLAMGTSEERRLWNYQARKLVSLCLFLLVECNICHQGGQDIVITSLALRFLVVLTDLKGWKCITDDNIQDADIAVKDLLKYIGSKKSGLYSCVRKYIYKLDSQISCSGSTDDRLLITASAITLALRPFHFSNLDINDDGSMELQDTAEQYCVIAHNSLFSSVSTSSALTCFETQSCVIALSKFYWCWHISKEEILKEMFELDRMTISSGPKVLPQIGWLLANIIYLATGTDGNSVGNGKFIQGIDYTSYIHATVLLAENLLAWFEKTGWMRKPRSSR